MRHEISTCSESFASGTPGAEMRTPKIRPLHGTLEKQGLWTLHAREQHTHASRLKVLQLHLDLRLKVIPNISALSRGGGREREREESGWQGEGWEGESTGALQSGGLGFI